MARVDAWSLFRTGKRAVPGQIESCIVNYSLIAEYELLAVLYDMLILPTLHTSTNAARQTLFCSSCCRFCLALGSTISGWNGLIGYSAAFFPPGHKDLHSSHGGAGRRFLTMLL